MDKLIGIPASPGIAISQAFWVISEDIQVEKCAVSDSAAELERLDHAITIARKQLDKISGQVLDQDSAGAIRQYFQITFPDLRSLG